MVRLITHNLLACHAKGCTVNNFPLIFQDIQIELHEQEFNPDFIKNILPRLEWRALVDSATLASVRIAPSRLTFSSRCCRSEIRLYRWSSQR